MITYNWTIATLERQTDTGGVITAHWQVNAQDGGYTASSYGTTGLQPDPSDPDFVPYDQLTEADVLAWVWGAVDKDKMEAALAANIEEQKAPSIATGLPWA
jgi:hypothetical protein